MQMLNSKSNNISKMQYNTLDLFCGCGGMSKGLEDAGLNVIAGIDIWDKAISSYEKNFKHQGICEDLTKLSPEQFQQQYNKDCKQVDIIVGGPPCFIAGMMVQTEKGYKKIENILIDDQLLTHAGKFQKILNLQRKVYYGDIYKLNIKYHPNDIYCTTEHPFYIRNRKITWNNSNRQYEISFDKPEWKNAKDLTENDYLGMVININNIIPEFTFNKIIDQYKIEKQKIILDKHEFWFMMGYFIRNGWIEYTKKTTKSICNLIKFSINNKDETEIVEKLRKVLPVVDQKDDDRKYKTFGCSNEVWFQILKMFGKHEHEKRIPEWVQNAPIEFAHEFVNGYMKAGILRTTTVSYNLALGLQRLYLKLGHILNINKIHIIDEKIINQKNIYCIEIIFNKLHSHSLFIEGNYVWYKLVNITKEHRVNVMVYNFEVESDNSYIVENTIVHNCQGFSMAGKRDKKDPRNSLFMEYVKYIDYFKPKAFVMENVIGILSMRTKINEKVIDIIMSKFEHNYRCVLCKLYASDFYVPQNRRRVIIIGVRKDLNIIPKEPTPRISKDKRKPVGGILLPYDEIDDKYYLSKKAIDGIIRRKKECVKNGKGFGAQFLQLNKPSYTISARYWKDGYDALVKYSDTKIRRLTITELKRIQTFPDNYEILGSNKEIITQIGNAVPCKFAKYLGKHLIKTLQQ